VDAKYDANTRARRAIRSLALFGLWNQPLKSPVQRDCLRYHLFVIHSRTRYLANSNPFLETLKAMPSNFSGSTHRKTRLRPLDYYFLCQVYCLAYWTRNLHLERDRTVGFCSPGAQTPSAHCGVQPLEFSDRRASIR
jgi:hypothetical protein